MPGLTTSLRRTSSPYLATSEGSGGRGPTSDISPSMTLKSCGSSSSDQRRSHEPVAVTRGSLRILNSRPSPSSRVAIASLRSSASGIIVRNLCTVNGCPSFPMRVWVKSTGPPSSRHDGNGDEGEKQTEDAQRGGGDGHIEEAFDRPLSPAELGVIHVQQRQPGHGPDGGPRSGHVQQGRSHAQVGPLLLQLPSEPTQGDAVHLGTREHRHRVRAGAGGDPGDVGEAADDRNALDVGQGRPGSSRHAFTASSPWK